jgi:hypothetical protein
MSSADRNLSFDFERSATPSPASFGRMSHLNHAMPQLSFEVCLLNNCGQLVMQDVLENLMMGLVSFELLPTLELTGDIVMGLCLRLRFSS